MDTVLLPSYCRTLPRKKSSVAMNRKSMWTEQGARGSLQPAGMDALMAPPVHVPKQTKGSHDDSVDDEGRISDLLMRWDNKHISVRNNFFQNQFCNWTPTCWTLGPDKGDADEDPDADLEADHLGALRRQAQLPDIPDDALPSSCSTRLMTLRSIIT